MSPSAAAPRILDAETAEERARNRQAWAELWQAVGRETEANDPGPEGEPDHARDGEPERGVA